MEWKELENEPTEDLIEFIRSKEDEGYRDLAKAAFTAFTLRFRTELIDKCVVICRRWKMDEHDAVEVATRSLERFLKYPYSFNKEKCNSEDFDQCVLLYLFGIARRVLADYANDTHYPYTGEEEIVTSLIDHKDVEPERKAELQKAEDKIDRALSSLSEKHKIIFLTYKAHGRDGRKLPRQLTEQLRERLNLTQSTIRVYKKEANEAFEKYISHGKR